MKKRILSTGVVLGLTLGLFVQNHGLAVQTRVLRPTFYPNHFSQMGDLAIIYNNDGIHGGQLYTLINHIVAGKNKVSAYAAGNHVLGAEFSPNGKWMAVTQSDGSQQSLWLVSSNGRIRDKLGDNIVDPVFPSPNQLMYSIGNKVYTMTLGQNARHIILSLPNNSSIRGISINHHDGQVAFAVVRNVTNYRLWYDEIMVWNRASHTLRLLVKAGVPNGLIVGPWAKNGDSLFYWNDPDHSASLLADGTSLYNIAKHGPATLVGHTFTTRDGVIPFGTNQAVVWNTQSRYLFAAPKTLQLWHDRYVPPMKNNVMLYPTISAQGSRLAFVYGLTLNPSAQGPQVLKWLTTLKLATFDLRTGTLTTLPAAGSGVSTPMFNATGQQILFTRQNDVCWIRVKNHSQAVPIVTMPGHTIQGYPQYGSILYAVEIADYLPKP